MGVATNGSGVTTDTWTNTAKIDLNVSSLPNRDLKLGLIDPSTSGFGTLTFKLTNTNTSTTILSQTFTSLASADAFFGDQVNELGKLSSFIDTNGKLDLTFALSLTEATNASFVTDFVLGNSAVPEPSPLGMIVVGGAALFGIMHRKKRETAYARFFRPRGS